MKKIILFIMIIFISKLSLGQILNLNSAEDFEQIKQNMKADYQELIIWGKYNGLGKCGIRLDSDLKIPSYINKNLKTALSLTLFNDTIKYYVPLSCKGKINYDLYKEKDIVKMRVLLFKNNPTKKNSVFFIIYEIL